MAKLAIKRLTASDLTFFVWHFRNNPAGNQKAINLNADVFVDQLYPALPDADVTKVGRISLDLSIYGPGAQPELNVQRKIVKTPSYKNWRLNGEFVDDPDNPARFSGLAAGDFVIFAFLGELWPSAAKAVFIARGMDQDAALHNEINRKLGTAKMIVVQPEELTRLIRIAATADSHPVNELTLDEALEDVAQGGINGADRLLRRRSGQNVSREQLARARRKVDQIGQQGEGFVNQYLIDLRTRGLIHSFDWVSERNAVAPYDFSVIGNNDEFLVDAKSTSGAFERILHISLQELREMARGSPRYELYRIYEMSEYTAKLRICLNTQSFALMILETLERLPRGVLADSISVAPELFEFHEPISIILAAQDMD